MRKFLWLVIAVAVIFPAGAWCQQPDQQSDQKTDPKQTQQQVHAAQGPQSAAQAAGNAQSENKDTTSSSATSDGIQVSPPQEDLLAAARKAREAKKESAKTRVFTNDNIPTTGGISAMGSTSAAAPGENAVAETSTAPNDEKTWRDKFAQLRHKLEQDQQELDVMQRELGVLDVQYYNDPVKAMQQQLTRSDINDKTAKIDAKKKAIEADQEAIDDAEEALRKAGGDPGWAR